MSAEDETTFGIIGAAMNEGLDGQTTVNASGHQALDRVAAELERLRARIAELEEENKNLNWQLDQEFGS